MRRGRIPKLRRQAGALFLLVVLAGILGAEAQTRPRELRLLHRAALPTGRSVPTDIRWAGNDSVYISWGSDGVAEVGLDGKRRRVLVPDVKTLGGIQHYTHLALSPKALAVASVNWAMTRRPLKAEPGGKVPFERLDVAGTNDFDLAGDRVLLLGRIRPWAVASTTSDIAWLGTLSGRLEDARSLLQDAGGTGAPSYYHCATYLFGAVRFLSDGSFVIAPGFQDGIHLFNTSGQKVRSWASQQAGVNSHVGCSEMTEEEEEQFRLKPGVWERWLNSRSFIDEILPLPQGPGLVVRSVGKDGRARWTLKILQQNGIATYTVPVLGRHPLDRLHGDVRNGRIVLLRSAAGLFSSRNPADFPAEILMMELPGDQKEGS